MEHLWLATAITMIFKAEQSCSSVQFSPFLQGRIAVACAQNFGIVGNGRVSVLQANQAGIEHVVSFDTLDGAAQLAFLGGCER